MELRNIKNNRKIWTHNDGDFIANKIKESGDYFEADILYEILPLIVKSKNIVEIGANIGNHILFYDEYIHPERVIAFEPLPQNLEILKRNINDFVGCDVSLNEFGLAVENDTIPFHVNPNNFGGTSILDSESNNLTVSVRVKGTKEIFKEIKSEIDFIKCDIEGGEKSILYEIFRFAIEKKALLWIEMSPQNYGIEYMGIIRELCNKYNLVFNQECDFIFDFSKAKKVHIAESYLTGYIYMLQDMYKHSSDKKLLSNIRLSFKEIGWKRIKLIDKLIWSKIYRFFKTRRKINEK